MSKVNNQDRQHELITDKFPYSPVSEAFRSLRTSLSFMSPDHPLQIILFTSAQVGDGKSLVLSNLAVSMAQNSQQVIIVDADLRRPMLHRFFGKPNHTGLSSVLTAETSFEDALQETGVENTILLSGGESPPNPTELLASQKMEQVLKKAKKDFDCVLVDSPPAFLVTDPVVLSGAVDGVIIVAAAQETEKEKIRRTKQKLGQAQANLIGTVLNKYPVGRRGYYTGYYNSYYGSSRE